MPQTEAWTVGRLLVWTTEYLGKHGSDSSRLDAEVLLAESLGCRRIELYTSYEVVPADDVRASFREMVRRRAEGTPVAYLVGHREFYSLEFRVTPDVLIPRPETEHLVIALLDLAHGRPADAELAVCDVGTGSGIIAVCAARQLPNCRVTALDTSPAALEVARSNAERHEVASRIEFLPSDLLAAVPPQRRFDFIVSNPPYVSRGEYQELPPEVRDHEPAAALLAGEDGTEVIRRLVPQAAERLQPGGRLLVEISPMIHDAVQKLVQAEPRLALEPTIKDLARRPRVVQALRVEATA